MGGCLDDVKIFSNYKLKELKLESNTLKACSPEYVLHIYGFQNERKVAKI